jgi:hypothetical protein
MPVPYSNRQNKASRAPCGPGCAAMAQNKAATSSGDSTAGRRRSVRGRPSSDIQGRSTPSTCWYRNNKADKACLCVDTDTLRSTASQPRKASTSTRPISAGWRRPWKCTKERTQYR